MGMTSALYRRVAPFFTVYSKRAKIDLITAPREVLLAVPGVQPGEIDALLDARARILGAMPREELPIPTAARGTFALSKRDISTIRAEAESRDGAVFVREVVIKLTKDRDRPFAFLAWKQGVRTPAEFGGND